jgi:hypothetical protein
MSRLNPCPSGKFSLKGSRENRRTHAGLAQLVEHFTCNEDVAGSTPASGSRRNYYNGYIL